MIWQVAELKQLSEGISYARLRRLSETSESKFVALDALSYPQLLERTLSSECGYAKQCL